MSYSESLLLLVIASSSSIGSSSPSIFLIRLRTCVSRSKGQWQWSAYPEMLAVIEACLFQVVLDLWESIMLEPAEQDEKLERWLYYPMFVRCSLPSWQSHRHCRFHCHCYYHYQIQSWTSLIPSFLMMILKKMRLSISVDLMRYSS